MTETIMTWDNNTIERSLHIFPLLKRAICFEFRKKCDFTNKIYVIAEKRPFYRLLVSRIDESINFDCLNIGTDTIPFPIERGIT